VPVRACLFDKTFMCLKESVCACEYMCMCVCMCLCLCAHTLSRTRVDACVSARGRMK